MQSSPKRGMTLIETVIATAILLMVMVSIGALVGQSIKQSKNMGSTMSQATALAAQKTDQLMTLQFTVGGTAALLAAGGSVAADTVNFVEYLDFSGLPVAGATSNASPGVFFTRRWKITDSTGTTKLIVVKVTGRGVATGTPPVADMGSIKAQQ